MSQANGSYDQSYYQDESYVEAPKAPKLFDPSYLIPRILFRWHWILIGLVIGLAYGFVSIKLATPMFKSQSTVRVADSNVDETLGTRDRVDLKGQDAVQAVREKFDRTTLFEALAEDEVILNLPELRPPPAKTLPSLINGEDPVADKFSPAPYNKEELASRLKQWTSISVRNSTRLIDITVLHPNGKVAQKIANRIIHHYKELRLKRIHIGADSDLVRLRIDLKSIEVKISEDKQLLTGYAPALDADKEYMLAKKALLELQATFGDLHPKMIEANERLKIRRGALVTELKLALTSQQDDAHWAPSRERLSNLENPNTFSEMRKQLAARVKEIESEVTNQEAQRDAKRETIAKRESTKDITEEAEVDIHETAREPDWPFSPNRGNIMTKGTIFGIAAGLALAFIFQLFDNKIGSVAEVEQAYELPVLSAVKKLPDDSVMEAEKAALIDLPNSFATVHPNLAVPGWATDPIYSEMFRVLRASVSLLGDASERNVTLVSSSIPGEGKTFVAANLALAFAKQGTKTLLIDFDLRKPAVHKIFGQPRHGFQGIVNVLNGTAGLGDVIATFEGFTNLSVIFSGVKSPSPGELLEPSKLYSVIEAYAGNFDHVIIDSAPLLPVPDTRIIAPLAHNFCLVVRADHTPRKATYSALELLAADGISPSGVVLNDFTEKRMQAGKYGYGYGYGEYGEGNDDDDDD